MNHTFLTLFVTAFALAASPVYALTTENIGDYTIEYDRKVESDTDGDGKNDRTSYYGGDTLLWSAYDESKDGTPDLWMRFRGGDTVDLELFDRDGNSEPDKIAEYDQGARREVVFDDRVSTPGSSSNAILFLVFGVIIALGYVIKKYPDLLNGAGKKDVSANKSDDDPHAKAI